MPKKDLEKCWRTAILSTQLCLVLRRIYFHFSAQFPDFCSRELFFEILSLRQERNIPYLCPWNPDPGDLKKGKCRDIFAFGRPRMGSLFTPRSNLEFGFSCTKISRLKIFAAFSNGMSYFEIQYLIEIQTKFGSIWWGELKAPLEPQGENKKPCGTVPLKMRWH